MAIRTWCEDDLAAIGQLFFEAVHRVNSRDYSPSQIQAWAPEPWPPSYWRERFQPYQVFVAELAGQVVGFAELDLAEGHVDCFYVHHAYQHQGIGRMLMQAIERALEGSGVKHLHADVSLTARAFFESMGFSVTQQQGVIYRGERFQQFRMQLLFP